MEERGYQVVRLLGQGGQGRVYEVTDKLGNRCVLKQLPWLGAEKRETALREVQLLSSLRHPCIVRYLDSFVARSTPSIPCEDVICLVMNYCEHDLRQECLQAREKNHHFEEVVVVSWLTQLCWGLQHLHARKFLHRDLKPQNVLLSLDRRAFLADFGVVGKMENSEDLRGTVVGTPAFMSPEMLEGRRYGCKTDLWALGCVLYEMMALEPPFACCGSYAAVVAAVLSCSKVLAPAGYGDDLSALAESLLSKSPECRPSTADMLRGYLRESFCKLLRSSASEFRDVVVSATTVLGAPQPDETEEPGDPPEYASDFESYSGSELESSPMSPELKMPRLPGEWRHLQYEAETLLERRPTSAPCQSQKLRRFLAGALGSSAEVDRAFEFLRGRRPLLQAISGEDEMVLQIEMVDHFGDAGLQALPLLERCLHLEERAVGDSTI